jgi:hypothetical protein
MGRLSMHSWWALVFPFWVAGGVIFCFFFHVPNVFPTCFHRVPFRFPKFPSCYLRHSNSTSIYLIWFAQSI